MHSTHTHTHSSNLGVAGGEKMCDTLLNAGALPATAALLKRSIESYPASEGNKTLREHILATLGNAINLLWLLWCVSRVTNNMYARYPDA